MQHPPKLVPIAARGDTPPADHRLPFEVSPAQVPFVHAVLDWLNSPVAYVDRDLRIRFANQAFAALVGMPRDTLIDTHLRDTPFARYGVDLDTAMAVERREFSVVAAVGPAAKLSAHTQRDEFGSVQGCLVLGAEDAVAERVRELEGLLHAIPGPACLVDAQQRYVFSSPSVASELGVDHRDIVGRAVADVFGPECWAELEPHFVRALEGERTEFRLKVPDAEGHERWVSRILVPRLSDDGHVIGTYIFGLDTHELETAREAFVAQREDLRGVLDSLPLPVAYLDLDNRFTLVNRPFCLLTGRDEASILGASFDDVVAHGAPQPHASAASYAQRGALTEFEWVMTLPDGSQAWRRFRLVPRRDATGRIAGVFVIVLDIHDEKLARLALEQRERQVREFADNIPQPVAYLGPNDRFGIVNKAFAQLVGQTPDRIVGRSLSEVFGDDSALAISDIHARVRAGEAVSEERMLAMPDGERRLVEIRWTPEAGVEGATRRGVYLMIVDADASSAARAAYEDSVAELRRAMNSIDTPIALVDANERFRFANASMQAWYGLPGEQIVGRELRTLFGDKLYAKSRPFIERALAGEEVLFEREFMFPGGVERWTRVRYVPQRGESRRVTGFYIVVFDVHDLKIQQRELQVKQEELRRANWLLSSHLENSPLAALELDADLNVRRWSERAERLFGWRRENAMNRSIWELSLIAEGEVDAITRSFALVLSARQQRVSALQRVTRQDGSRIWCEWYISALADETGEVASIFALVQDVNQRVEAEARLQQLAAFDSLTGLPNRSSLQFELAQALDRARRSNTGVAALFIDLDHFKNVNDTLGHRIGDQLLLSVARILKSCVRKGDMVSRMGGDEFMVVVEHQKVRTAAQHVANKILVALNQPLPVEGHMLTVAASVGIAVFPDHGADANMLLKNSDVAMYHAKELGKGRFEFYSDELAREREEQALIEFSLRVAMASNQLSLAYQPRVTLDDGRIEGAEALLRWRHPELGDIPPKKFIRVAEETGLIFELGTWVFRKACQQLREWERDGLPVRTVSVNFSARQLLTRDLVDRISMILAETGCDPRRIEIEITETSMMFDVTTTKRVITSLKRLGMRIAIDDFGTGFSSLSHLQQLDIDALKIDQSFIRDLLLDAGDAAITRAVVALGRGIGLQVIAEGVENARQLSFLRDCGCDLYQGFHFSPAVAPKDFELLVRAQQSRGKGSGGAAIVHR